MKKVSTEQTDGADTVGEALGRMIAYVLILGILVLLARVAIIPFRLVRIYWRTTRSVKHTREQAKGRFHFWLTESEKHRFKAVYRNLQEAELRREQTIQIADDNGVPKDTNGRYNSSTEIGARVRAQMETLDSIIGDASRVIIDLSGAEFLSGRGDALFTNPETSETTPIQTPVSSIDQMQSATGDSLAVNSPLWLTGYEIAG